MPRSVAGRAVHAADNILIWLESRTLASVGPEPDVAAVSEDECNQVGPRPAGEGSTVPTDNGDRRRPAHLVAGATLPPVAPTHTDWLYHRLEINGPAAQVSAFRAAAAGAGVIPWHLDLDRMEEDFFLRVAAPPPGHARSLSMAGCRMLAAELRDAVARRHALAVARLGQSAACPFDLHALLPVPATTLQLGPDHPEARAWLWTQWGTTQALRHVAVEADPARRRAGRCSNLHRRLLVGGLDTVARAGDPARAVAGAGVHRHAALRAGVTGSVVAAAEGLADTWEQPLRPPEGSAPVLAVDGFEGPLDWLLEMARAQRIDLAQLSILTLVEAFTAELNAALARDGALRVDLSRWGEWLVMAATLALLRSRLMLPKDAPEAKAARDEAEALRRSLLDRAAMQQAAAWLDRQPQLGRDTFGRGGAEPATVPARVGDITELLRACLVALRVPDQVETYQPHRPPFWRVADAAARITRMLVEPPHGGELGLFLPAIDAGAPERELRCRAALASTFMAGLELAREGKLRVEQGSSWQDIVLNRAGFPGRSSS
jgi:segregation and condensation protein A